MSFSTSAAHAAFTEAFTVPATAVLSPPVAAATSKEVYTSLGRLWASGHRAVQALEGAEQHVPAADSSLKEDVAGAVETTLDGLWVEHKPKIGGIGSVIVKRIAGTMTKVYDESMRGAAAHAAAAADRAAATPFGGLPVQIHTPGSGEGPAEPKDGALDIIDALEGRIRAGLASGEMAANPTEKGPGNDRAAEAGREVAVSPALALAAKRLVSVVCPPLRVEKRYGELLALHLLQSKDTFTAYAESKGLSGSALREVMTIARALDLATQHQGAQYLISEPAEVQLRRFYSVILASKLGSFKLSQHLEELPGEGALAELPQSIVREMSEALKLELKIEQLVAGTK